VRRRKFHLPPLITRVRDPGVFVPQLKSQCADAGVAVVLVPAPAGCPVSGAAKWIGSQRGLIVLSLRGMSDDKLWFSFFHEAAHLLKHGKSLTFLDILGDDGLDPEAEAEADAFARETLIASASYQAFIAAKPRPSATSVTRFAAHQGISPGIVVGRLQFDRVIPYSYLNHLKVSYSWAERPE
jgi:HTH-type transcriptional regulator / antitoxin HigA